MRNTYDQLSKKERDILNDNHLFQFDMKKVAKLEYSSKPTKTYLEELLLPRYSSSLKYSISPLIFTGFSAFYGLSRSIYMSESKFINFGKYARNGFLLGLPYYAFNEVITGLIIREYGREQYFYSHTGSAFLCYLGVLAYAGIRKKRGGNFVKTIQKGGWSVLGVYFTSLWLEFFYILKRSSVIERGITGEIPIKRQNLAEKADAIQAFQRKLAFLPSNEKSEYEKKIQKEIENEIKVFEELKRDLIQADGATKE